MTDTTKPSKKRKSKYEIYKPLVIKALRHSPWSTSREIANRFMIPEPIVKRWRTESGLRLGTRGSTIPAGPATVSEVVGHKKARRVEMIADLTANPNVRDEVIGAKYGFTRETVCRYRRTLGLPPQPRKERSYEDKSKLNECRDEFIKIHDSDSVPTIRALSQRFGVSHETIRKWRQKLGITKPRKQKRQDIIDFVEQNPHLHLAQISKALQMNPETIKRALKLAGMPIPYKKHKYSNIPLKKLDADLLKGEGFMSHRQIAKKYGCSQQFVQLRSVKLGARRRRSIPLSPEVRATIMRELLKTDRLNDTAIARIAGCTQGNVRQWRVKLGLPVSTAGKLASGRKPA